MLGLSLGQSREATWSAKLWFCFLKNSLGEALWVAVSQVSKDKGPDPELHNYPLHSVSVGGERSDISWTQG